ncbi:MAG TPA: hypothetical protein VK054_10845 [Beutenbergiaceae bacterium]|nr:hypothetical protein [Beutenbergiaceae bacterium]
MTTVTSAAATPNVWVCATPPATGAPETVSVNGGIPTALPVNAGGERNNNMRDRILARIAMRLLDLMSKEPKDRLIAVFKKAVQDEYYYKVRLPVPPPRDPVEIRYAELANGKTELDEVIIHGGTVHIEKMNTAQWWIGIDVDGRSWHLNLGGYGPATEYAFIEEDVAHA